ncbi:MAG: DUF1684 domain-containing protein [Saprospiraceae bacterium]|nr:DUF1684 domain-containing protein [Saprospiraceae bacterium]
MNWTNCTTEQFLHPLIYKFIRIWLLCLVSSILSAQNDYALSIQQHRTKIAEEHLKDQRSPLRKGDLKKLRYFPADEQFSLFCNYQKITDADSVIMPTTSGRLKYFVRSAKISFQWNESIHTLFLYRPASAPDSFQHLFLLFYDQSNGEETYAGGRYLDLEAPLTNDNGLLVDFNKAYNPWCAYSDGFNCPIPPEENRLSFPLYAGEKLYKGKHRLGPKSSNARKK